MKSSIVAVSFGLLITLGAGCGKSDPVSKLTDFKDQMCACKQDKDPTSCAVKVNVASKQWGDALDEKSITPEMEAKMDPLEAQLAACREAILK